MAKLQYKQARTVHAHERELSELLALVLKIWRYSSWREQETKALIHLIVNKYERERFSAVNILFSLFERACHMDKLNFPS